MAKNTLNIAPSFLESITTTYHDFERKIKKLKPYQKQKLFPKSRLKKHLKELLEVSLWASLTTEERRQHRFSVVYVSPENIMDYIAFAAPLPFNPETLAKLSPALESTGTVAVWSKKDDEDKLEIWGFTHPLLSQGSGILVTAIAPAQLLLWLRAYEVKAKVTGIKAEMVEDWLFREFFDKIWPVYHPDPHFVVNAQRKLYLKKIALSMRDHGHGGALLIIPPENKEWSPLIEEGQFKLKTPYGKFKEDLEKQDEIVRQCADGDTEAGRSIERLPRALGAIAQLTAVDGATLIRADFEILGFGVKIKMQGNGPKSVSLVDQFEQKEFNRVPFKEMPGGMRHKSAAHFVFNYDGAVAIVASEDGRISLFKKRDNESIFAVRDLEFLWL
jgi:hypothetical protein